MMRRRRGKRRKPQVRWLQDTQFTLPETLATTDGVINTTFLLWDDEVDQEEWDPAQTRRGSATIGEGSQFQLTPQAELREDRGWRMMRCVGEFTVGLYQSQHTGDNNTAANVLVSAGLCVLDYDDDGNIENADEWHLGPTVFPEDDESVSFEMRGMGNSWIWRRQWILSNVLANAVAGASQLTAIGWPSTATYQANTYSPDPKAWPLGPAVNNGYPSIHLGAHFDIKRHVTLKHNQRLAWAIAAHDMARDNTSKIAITFTRTYRSLIARAGRPFRGSKR